MHLYIVAIGDRMPRWVEAGVAEYMKRLAPPFKPQWIEVPARKRPKGADVARLLETEGQRLIDATPARAHVIALERTGRTLTTHELAQALSHQMQTGGDMAFWIGGPEGLSPRCLKQAHACWSLSALTLPHPLVRVLLAEQIYRAVSIINNLPYHR